MLLHMYQIRTLWDKIILVFIHLHVTKWSTNIIKTFYPKVSSLKII